MKKLITLVVLSLVLLNTGYTGSRPVNPDTGKPQEPKKPAPGQPECIAPDSEGKCTK